MSNTRKRLTRRAAAGATATAMLLPALALTAAPASALPGFALSRLAGGPAAPDRYGTASQIALDTFGTAAAGGGAPVVVLARGDRFPDALAGSYLAGGLTTPAPILLTQVDSVPQVTLDTLAVLGAEEVVILGGTAAVSAAVQTQLDATYTVRRLAGPDRYTTAAAVARDLPATQIVLTDSSDPDTTADERTAFLASGAEAGGGADALAAGPVAYSEGAPVLLTAPDALPDATRQALIDLGIERLIVLGGSAAVSEDVVASLPAGITADRVAGPTRGATAAEIARLAVDEFFFTDQAVGLANGSAFADALTAASRAGLDGFPILLTLNANELGEFTQAYLNANAGTLIDGVVFGGSAVVSEALVTAAEEAGQVDTVAPTVLLEVPSEALSVNTAAFTIVGSTEAGATVSVRSGATEVASVTADVAGDFSAPVTLADGANDYTIVATDTAGNVSTVTTVPTITLDTVAPAAATVTTPAAAVSVPATTATFDIVGTAEAGATVVVRTTGPGGADVATAAADEVTGDYTATVPLVEGANTFEVVSSDAAGNPQAAPTAVPVITREAPAGPRANVVAVTGVSATVGAADPDAIANDVTVAFTVGAQPAGTTFQLQRATVTAGTPGAFADVTGATGSTSPLVQKDVAAGDYQYRVVASAPDDADPATVDSAESAASTTVTVAAAPPDTTAPTSTSTGPANNATGVATNTNLTASFNEAVPTGTATVTLPDGTGAVTGVTTTSGNTVVFNPDANLAASTAYVATFTGTDAAANTSANVVVNFTTGTGPDATAPAFASASAAGATNLLTVTYGEAVNCATVTAGDYSANDAVSNPGAPNTFNPASVESCSGTSVVLRFPGTAFSSEAGNVFLRAGAVVEDLAGNAQAGADTIGYTTTP